MRRPAHAAAAAAASCLLALPLCSQAGSLRLCAGPDALSAAEKDRILRFGAVVKDELARSGQSVALIARSGLDLSHFAQRYSHAGVTLQASTEAPWSVRQLYYACDESRPRLYDQGIAGFVLGTDEPALGYVSLVFLPAAQGAPLQRAALDKVQVLQLLHSRYSANAYPYSVQYQNCNQWLVELLALAWAPLPADDAARRGAQQWLQAQGYAPSVLTVGWRPLMWLGQLLLPWVHGDDHPDADLAQARYQVSMPASIEAFVHEQAPAAQRVELCHNRHQVVVHRGWEPIADGCIAGPSDQVYALDGD